MTKTSPQSAFTEIVSIVLLSGWFQLLLFLITICIVVMLMWHWFSVSSHKSCQFKLSNDFTGALFQLTGKVLGMVLAKLWINIIPVMQS